MAGAKRNAARRGATIVFVDGTYDDACDIALAEAARNPQALLIQDTSRPGYTDVPEWVIEGYGTLGLEIDDQPSRAGGKNHELFVGHVRKAPRNREASVDPNDGPELTHPQPRAERGACLCVGPPHDE